MITILPRRAAWTILTTVFASVSVPAAEVSGVVLGENAKPVAHAVIRVIPEPPPAGPSATVIRTETGDDGVFVARGLTGEVVRIRVDADGYAPLTQPGTPVGSTLQVLLGRGVQLTGVVRDRDTQKPIGGATILAWDRDALGFGEEAYRKGTSGKDGRFVVPDLPAGKMTVEARAAGRAPARLGSVPVPKRDLQLFLEAPGGLGGRVTDTSGDPIAGAEVKVLWRDAAGDKSRVATTGADGRYRLAGIAALPITRITVRAANYLATDRAGPAPADGVLDVVLERGGSIVGTVRGYDGAFPASFRLSLRPGEDEPSKKPIEREFTNPDGSFRVDELEPGTYAIEATAETYASASKREIHVVAEQVADAGTLTLPSRSTLRGLVLDARDRAPVSGASVTVTRVDASERPATLGSTASWTETTASDGSFAAKEIQDGTYDVLIQHPQFAAAQQQVTFRADADHSELTFELFRGGALTGTVLNAKLEPVPGVRIVAAPGAPGDARVADTGSDGRYFIDALAPGVYTVTRAQERGGVSAGADTKTATIHEGETTTVDFDETPKITVSGIVRKGDVPIPAASVHFIPTEPGARLSGSSTRTDQDGAFQVGLRQGGVYQVSVVFGVENASNAHNLTTVTIPDQPEVHQDIVFDALAITGTVLDAERKGIGGALVMAIRDGAPAGGTARQTTTMTGAGGTFRLEAVDPGTYRVSAKAPGYGAGEAYPVVVNESVAEPAIELELDRGWIMRGRLVDSAGRGVPGALVVVAPPGMAESGYLPAQTDVYGGFRITAPADAPVSVAAISSRFAPAVQHGIEPPADANGSEVELRASPGGTLRVRVVHRRGGPAPGAQVTYQPVPLFPGCDVVVERNRPRSTDADGVTLLERLHPGAYLVSLAGRRNATMVQAEVYEGVESAVVLEVP